MSEAFDWSSPKTYIFPVDIDDYLVMPEDVAGRIEIKDGMIVHCDSASPNHNAIARNLQNVFLRAMDNRPHGAPCLRVNGDVDMLVTEVPFHYKRPDVLLYRCVEESRGKWKTKPTVGDALLVIEIVSPTTLTADLIDKRAEYARYGIPHYWIVRMANDDGPVVKIEMLELDSDGTYGVQEVRRRPSDGQGTAIETLEPLELKVTWVDLDVGVD